MTSSKLIGVYCIKNTSNNKIYIGQSDDIKRRFRRHKTELRNDKHINVHLQNAWNKYGEKAFEFLILDITESIEGLDDLEKQYIKELDTFRNGYNRTPGGESGYTSFLGKKHSEESKKKMRLAKLGKRRSEETKANMRKSAKGFTGKHSLETKKKMSEKAKGRTFSKETVEKIRAKSIGRTHDDESKRKMSIAHKGKVLSEETKTRISKTKQIEFSTEQISQIKSMIDKGVSFRKIGKMFNCSYSTISRRFKN